MTQTRTNLAYCSLLAVSFLLAACGSDDEPRAGQSGDVCAPDEEARCEDGLVCDPRADGSAYVCGEPAVIRGRVADTVDADALAGGRVVVLGADGSPAADVAYTDDDGMYSAVVTAPRNADGTIAETGGPDGTVVGEVEPNGVGRSLSLRPGTYFLRARGRDELYEGEVELVASESRAIDISGFRRVAYARLVRKGARDAGIAHGPELGISARTALPGGSSWTCGERRRS